MRLIDADKLETHEQLEPFRNGNYEYVEVVFKDDIDDAPTIELEQKKGKWQRRKGSDCWECSQCHAVLENDDLGMHNFYFCYHCGANMMDKSGYMDIEEVHYG